MRRKMIEQIKPLAAQKEKAKFIFVAKAAVVKLGKEDHLIIDIFRNLKKHLKQPVIRVALTDKDYGNYTGEGGWDRRNLDNARYTNYGHMLQSHNIAINESDKDLIKKFCGQKWDSWMHAVEDKEKSIAYAARERSYDRRNEELKQRISDMPDIPEGFYQWCDEELMKNQKYIFYKRKGRFAEFGCGSCGQIYKYATKALNTYEGQFEHIVPVPVAGQIGKCEKCHTEAVYKTSGRGTVIEDKKSCYLIQKFGESGGVVVRYFDIYKTTSIAKASVFEDVEIARSFLAPGMKKVQKDYHVRSGFDGTQFWMPCNLSGLANINQNEARLYPGSAAAVRDTAFRYSAIDLWQKDHDIFKWTSYLEAYWRTPQLEMIIKMGLSETALRLISGAGGVINIHGKNAADVLMIDKNKIQKLIKEKGHKEYHGLLKTERKLGLNLKEHEEDDLIKIGLRADNLKRMLRYMSARQLINRVKKYAGVETLDLCGAGLSHVTSIALTYADYLEMRETLEYDLTNQIYLHPRDLREEHNKLVLEVNAEKSAIRMREANQKYADIAKNYKSLCERYGYEDEQFTIRPANSAKEIVEEGLMLHHCVGGNGYLKSHNSGDSIILLLRPTAEKRIPFVTVQITGNRIIQWYGAYDKKVMSKEVDKWLQKYIKMLQAGTLRQDSFVGVA